MLLTCIDHEEHRGEAFDGSEDVVSGRCDFHDCQNQQKHEEEAVDVMVQRQEFRFGVWVQSRIF
jgi:hypothetical protein